MCFLVLNVHFKFELFSTGMLVNATFSIAAMVIHKNAAIPETAQLACGLNQSLYVVKSSELF